MGTKTTCKTKEMSVTQKHVLFLIALGAIFFFPFLGNVHLFDWDEINFAESAREMIETNDYFRVQINYEPFWEKPPFFFWLQVVSMKIFGINEFAARFPNALLGIISLVTIYFIGKKLISDKFGLIWSMVYFASFLPHMYFKSGIIDPFFNFFIFLSLFFLILTIEKPTTRKTNALISGIFIGLAIITKGPVGLLLLVLTLIVYLIAKKGKAKIKPITVIIFFFSSLGVTFLWFGYETITNSPWFILEFIHYQIELLTEPVAGHQQPFYYHFVVVLLGCFPMSILAIPMFFKKQPNIPYNLLLWMKILFWVVMILFTIVETKIVHYSSMSYLPLSFLSAIYLYFFLGLKEKKIELKALKTSYITIGTIFGTLLTIVPIVFKNHTWITPYIKDDFAVASFQNPINWGGWEFIFGLLFLAGLFWSLIYFIKEKVNQFLTVLVFATGTTLLGYSIFIVPKIEQFSQGPAIDFYESMQGKDVYVTTLGFKSYGQYFYTLFPPRTEKDEIEVLKNNYKKSLVTPNSYDANELNSLTNEWLLKGNIDKDVYLVTKITKREEMKLYTDISFIENKGGFDFYVRKHN
ncbi:MAG: glycosyltransferase family 39 protein [Flavobacteriales bacterium]|jgi:4-amino-4-deoxy-L-arabinose transferase-like glycosyltransferase